MPKKVLIKDQVLKIRTLLEAVHFRRDQSFNKKTAIALGIECEAQASFIVTHGIYLIIVQLKYLH